MAKATTTTEAAPKAAKDTTPKPGTPQHVAAKYGISLNDKGKFAPGHDAKLKSAMVKLILAGGKGAAQARKDLDAVGWGKYIPSDERIEATKAKAKAAADKAKAQVVEAEADGEAPGSSDDVGF